MKVLQKGLEWTVIATIILFIGFTHHASGYVEKTGNIELLREVMKNARVTIHKTVLTTSHFIGQQQQMNEIKRKWKGLFRST